MTFSVVNILPFLLVVTICYPIGHALQVYLTLGSGPAITTNNSEILITDIGEDAQGGLPSLTCHTDLTYCCRGADTGIGGLGQWTYPDGSLILNNAGSTAAGQLFYSFRNTYQLIRLAHRNYYYFKGPTGSYCCTIPTTGGEMTFCANLVLCPSLVLLNGIISYSDPTLGEGTVATYTCDPYYTLIGESTRTCGSDGIWNGSHPTCQAACSSLPPLTNGMISYSNPTLSEGTVATHTCSRIGYSPIGNTARICQSDGTWSGSSVTCQVVDCGQPIVPRHGRVHLPSGTTYGNFAHYFCDECSNINGVSDVQYCGPNGVWLLPAPTCRVLSECGLLATPVNGHIEMSAGDECGSIADYSCTVGYELRGVVSRVCQVDGFWNGTMPSCERIDCGPLESPTNGIVRTPLGTLFMSEATYQCNGGYEISGASHRSCAAGGQWRPNEPSCDPVDCGLLGHPANGRVTYSATTFTNEAIYSCNYGYVLQGSASRTCNANGEWQPSKPTCHIVDCGLIRNPTNGMVYLLSGTVFMSVATFTCDTGYTLSGSSFSNCGADGLWSSFYPACNAVDCGALEDPIHGSVDVSHGTTFGEEAVYSCSDGYLLNGQNKRTCTENGRWSPDRDRTSICDPVDCRPLSVPVNGRVDTSSGTTFMSAVVYSCSTGYNLHGTRSRVCEANGLWSSTPPTCKIVECGPLDNPENGLVKTESGTIYNSVVEYYCNEGYQLAGRGLLTCMANGQWSPLPPTCDPLDCGKIEAPNNGNVVTSFGTIFNSSAKFSCDSGFNLTGCSSAQCLSNGSWSCDPPHCADNSMIQLKFGPTVHCVSWTEGMVELMYKSMQSSVAQAIQSSGHVIPKENIQPGYFSCYRSTTETTYRTTITGTESLSAVEYADLISEWVESGVTTRVQWYVIKIKKACPVAIASMEEEECE